VIAAFDCSAHARLSCSVRALFGFFFVPREHRRCYTRNTSVMDQAGEAGAVFLPPSILQWITAKARQCPTPERVEHNASKFGSTSAQRMCCLS
jgi:hypothetical protein